ncbi:MAG: hypothetical protein NTY72_11570 [Bacteroidetes bacterium]|nr:hypothetical protein [Bacteroidota bacterium]
MKSISSALILFHFFIPSFAQNKQINKTLEYISQSNPPTYIFGKLATSKYLSLNKPFNNNIQSIIKSDSGIFCLVNGTGMIFKYSNPLGQFSRIDSTIFFGYNMGAFPFSYKSDIYNLGGTGFWRSTGHLRKYNFKAHEWDIVPLNEEMQITSSYKDGKVYFDQSSGKIYSGYSYNLNDGINPQAQTGEYIYKVMSLDLATKEWSNLGDLNKNLIQDIEKEFNIAITPFGLLTINNTNINLWDFKNNKHFQLDNTKNIFQSIIRVIDTTEIFYKDSYLFLCSGDNRLDSIKLTIKDFRQTGSIYSTSIPVTFNPYKKAIYLLAIVLFLSLCYLGLAVYKKRIISNYEVTAIAAEEANLKNVRLFKEQELLLLNLLITKSSKGIKTSIEEINTALGMDSRSPETQKLQRHKVITSINNIYISITDRKLILNEKLDFDRRTLAYFIAKDELKTLLKYMPID